MKPFIVCHMMASLDGRIDCDMLEKCPGGDCYYDVLDSYKCQAFIEGRVSRAKHAALPEEFEASDKTPCVRSRNCRMQAWWFFGDRSMNLMEDGFGGAKALLTISSACGA